MIALEATFAILAAVGFSMFAVGFIIHEVLCDIC